MQMTERIRRHIQQMSPHQRGREQGFFLMWSLQEIEMLRNLITEELPQIRTDCPDLTYERFKYALEHEHDPRIQA